MSEEIAGAGESVMSRLARIRGVTWTWDDAEMEATKPGRQMGVIAQEVQAVFPELIVERETGYLAVDYAGLVAPVIEAVKELDARLRSVEERLARMEDGGPPDPA